MSRDLERRKSDYLLELALEEQLEQDSELRKYGSGKEAEFSHVFSEEHNKKIGEILRKADKIEKRPERRKCYRQIAAGLALVICLSGATVSQVEAFRLPILRFIIEVKEKYTFFGVKKEYKTVTKKFAAYEPIYIPDGFAVAKVSEGKRNFGIRYWNEETNQTYTYSFSEHIADVAVDTEDSKCSEVEVNGNKAYLILKGKKLRLLMDQSGHRFFLEGNISYEEAIKIMESIKTD